MRANVRSVCMTFMLCLAAATGVSSAVVASGQPPGVQPSEMELPWTDVAPTRDGSVVRAAAVGAPDARIGRFSARRASARSEARRRALDAVHAWVDNALAAVRADPRRATAVHAAIDRDVEVVGVRPLVDGGAVVLVEVAIVGLRSACAIEGLPWVD